MFETSGVIFDMDGVIFDTECLWKNAFEAANQKFGLNLTEKYRQSTCGKSEQLIREELSLMPRDIRLKRLAGHLLMMSQSGQYNFTRMCKRGEWAAAGICVYEYAKNAIASIYLLNNEYMPYYKWQLRGLKELDILSELALPIEFLLTAPNEESYVNEKIERMELIAGAVIEELISQGITEAICGDLTKHAYSVNDYVNDGDLRNLNILSGV